MVKWYEPKNNKDILHYMIVYGVLVFSWVPMMNFFNNEVSLTAFGGLLLFYATDKVAHYTLKVD